MKIFALQGGSLCENTYFVVKDGKALIIDPGIPSEIVLEECKRLSAQPIAVLLTHGHFDHVKGAAGLQRTGLKIYAHKEEFSVIAGRANLALALRESLDPFVPDVAVEDDDLLDLTPFEVKVLFTPGHTQGGVCYLIEDCLFSGDTIFPGSYGRTDFPTGDSQDLLCSIADVLFDLPPETKVYCGHGDGSLTEKATLVSPDTTIGAERATNPILDLL